MWRNRRHKLHISRMRDVLRKNMATTTTVDNQNTRKTIHQNINEEDINYDQNLGTTTTTINF